MIPKDTFKELDGGGKKSKGAGKSSKGPTNKPAVQMAETPPADATADATFDQPSSQDDATFENPDKSG